jgi:putative copper export protein
VRRRRLGQLGMAAGLLLALAFAWFVLVAARDPSSADAPVDRIGARVDGTLLDSLLADRLQALVGWIASVSTTLVLGGVIFQLFVAGSRALPQARTARSATGHSAGLSVLRKAAIVGILAELASLLLRAAALSSDGFEAMRDADTLRFVMAGRFGDAAFLRIAGLALLAGFLPVLPIGPASRRPGSDGSGRAARARRLNGVNGVNGHAGAGRNGHSAHSSEVLGRRRIYPRRLGGTTPGYRMWLERVVCVVGGLIVLLSYAIVGHPQATQPAALFVPIQCVHIVAASTWFGGVAFLAVELRQQKREGTARDFAEVVRRFSTVAGAMIALLGVSGLLMANSQLDSIDALRETAYGRALLVKMLVLAVPVAVSGYNRQRVVPAIVNRDEPSAWRHLRITLMVETVVIALGVLLATAAMTSGGFK